MVTDECQACGASVWMLRHFRTGKTAPIDTEAAADGNVVLVTPEVYRVTTKAEPAPAGEPLYKSHFATCPEASRFRRS